MTRINEVLPLDSVVGECLLGEFRLPAKLEFSFAWVPYPRPRVHVTATDVEHDIARFLFKSAPKNFQVEYRGQLLECKALSKSAAFRSRVA